MPTKSAVREHWEHETCGTRYGKSEERAEYFKEISRARYALEPFIHAFADFDSAAEKDVLEIGVGAGSDFEQWCANARTAMGVDLTQAGLELTRERLSLSDFASRSWALARADAENLPFQDSSFDIVYSWGVLHHTPDTRRALKEAARVLRPGGRVSIMVYHVPSWTGLNLSLLYGAGRLRKPLSQRNAIFEHLESPGTKAYGVKEFHKFLEEVGLNVEWAGAKVAPGDLLNTAASSRYQGRLFRLIWKVYPRWFVRMCGDRFGLYLMATCRKPARPDHRGDSRPLSHISG